MCVPTTVCLRAQLDPFLPANAVAQKRLLPHYAQAKGGWVSRRGLLWVMKQSLLFLRVSMPTWEGEGCLVKFLAVLIEPGRGYDSATSIAAETTPFMDPIHAAPTRSLLWSSLPSFHLLLSSPVFSAAFPPLAGSLHCPGVYRKAPVLQPALCESKHCQKYFTTDIKAGAHRIGC